MDVDATSQESESLMTPAAMAVFDGDKDAFKPLSKAVISSLKPTNAKPMESWAAIESSLEESGLYNLVRYTLTNQVPLLVLAMT